MVEEGRLINIIVDDREMGCDVPGFLASYANVDVNVSRLPLGDYLVNDNLLFERKTLRDLVYSIIDGRVFSQAARLSASDYQGIFILEGTSADITDFKMKRKSIQGALIYISVILGIPVLRSTCVSETASLIFATARQVNNVAEGKVVRHGGRAPKGKKHRQLYLLQGLPGVGKKRAELLLQKFENVENVVNASYEELMEIDGVGKKMADSIRHVLSEEQAVYGIGKRIFNHEFNELHD